MKIPLSGRGLVPGVVALLTVLALANLLAAGPGTDRSPPESSAALGRAAVAPGTVFYPGGWTDAAPNGVPDFDQKQQPWFDINANWSWDGPLAAANALWYLDSVHESAAVPPPALSDTFPLVESYSPGTLDDHDPGNLLDLASDLAERMDTDGAASGFLHEGTDPVDLEIALDNYLMDKGVDTLLGATLVISPTIEHVTSAVAHGDPVLLLLGYWQPMPDRRLGGHWATVVGADIEDASEVCLADPFADNAEAGGDGVVLGHPGGPHTSDVHTDPALASHDCYQQSGRAGPGGVWGPDKYPLVDAGNFFVDMNNTADLAVYYDLYDADQPIAVQVEYALIMPAGTIRGDCNCDGRVDAGDIAAEILEIFDGDGSFWLDVPMPTFPGCPLGCDANADFSVDAGDIACTILIIFNGQGACGGP